jgi:hypothetical protein
MQIFHWRLLKVPNLQSTFSAQNMMASITGPGRSYKNHPKNENIVSSTPAMDEETRRIIINFTIVNTVPSPVRCLTHQMTGQNFTTDQIANMCHKDTEDNMLDVQDLLNSEKQTSSASRKLKYLAMNKDAYYIAILQDPGSNLFRAATTTTLNLAKKYNFNHEGT